jgi:hypothetical protein
MSGAPDIEGDEAQAAADSNNAASDNDTSGADFIVDFR